jgi:hypothetical protein
MAMKKEKKRQREEAIKAEISRREEDRRNRSPLTREEMLDLLGFVGEKIMTQGHEKDFSHTSQWLQDNGFDEQTALSFFRNEKITDDWSLCLNGDPYALFGPSEERLAWMPIECSQLEALLEWLDKEMPVAGCNHDLRLTSKWLQANDCPLHPTLMALMVKGGGCDCEVVMNIEPESIYCNYRDSDRRFLY